MKKHLLYEISVIRPLIIFLLVVYHTLCVFTGGWRVPEGVADNATYWWLGHLISGFRIETIAFVGGYVFCYQCVELGKRSRLLPFVWKKCKRLLIPCFIFGTAYYFLYRYTPARFHWNVAFWRVANGVEHLWFLPMLFWCFVAAWMVDWLLRQVERRWSEAYRPVGWMLLVVAAGVSMLRPSGLRMGLTRVNYFFFYFYLGYWLQAVRADKAKRCNGGELMPLQGGMAWGAVLWVMYVCFLLLHLQSTHLQLPGCGFDCPAVLRGTSQWQLRLYTLGHTACGIMALYCSVVAALDRCRERLHETDIQPSGWLKECSRLCYGVYVLHMFFIQYIYYYTPLPQWMCGSAAGAWLMPWATLVILMALSVTATHLMLKTRWGRWMIG